MKKFELIQLIKEEILKEIKVNRPDPELGKAYLKISQYIKNGSKGSLNLGGTPITSLGNLQSVGGDLYLYGTPITSLGNLQSVEGSLYLGGTPITSLGNLQSVGGYLNLYETPLSQTTTEEEIRQKVDVKGRIYL